MKRNFFSHLFLIICSFFTLFPFLWLIISSTNSSAQIISGRMSLGKNFVSNVIIAITKANVLNGLKNSLCIAIITVILTLIISSLAGYSLVVFPDNKRNFIFKIMLFSLMIPFSGQLIPLFKIFTKLKLLNTFTAIILPGISSIYLTFFFKQSFSSFSKELIEAVKEAVKHNSNITDLKETLPLGASEDVTMMMERVLEKNGKATYMLFPFTLKYGHHHPKFDLDESVLHVAVSTYIDIVNWLMKNG